MTRELLINGHIVAVVNLEAADGTPVCHLLLRDDANGAAAVMSIKTAAVVVDTKDASKSWAKAAAKYKRANGEPLHQFAGNDIRRSPTVKEA
jgi:hypothetical protein